MQPPVPGSSSVIAAGGCDHAGPDARNPGGRSGVPRTHVTPKAAAHRDGQCRGRFTRLESRPKPGKVPLKGRSSPGFPGLHPPPRTDPLDPWGRSAKSLEPHDSCVCLWSSLPCPPEAAVETDELLPWGGAELLGVDVQPAASGWRQHLGAHPAGDLVEGRL